MEVKECIYIIQKTNRGFIILSSTIIVIILISITMFTVMINKSKTNANTNDIQLKDVKISLEACALNLVGNKNVTRQVSEQFKSKNDLLYRIDNYNNDYIIYVYDPNYSLFTYYMIFNNRNTNINYDHLTIYEDGYLKGVANELES